MLLRTGCFFFFKQKTAYEIYWRLYRVPRFGDCCRRRFCLSSPFLRRHFSLARRRRRQTHGATISERISRLQETDEGGDSVRVVIRPLESLEGLSVLYFPFRVVSSVGEFGGDSEEKGRCPEATNAQQPSNSPPPYASAGANPPPA